MASPGPATGSISDLSMGGAFTPDSMMAGSTPGFALLAKWGIASHQLLGMVPPVVTCAASSFSSVIGLDTTVASEIAYRVAAPCVPSAWISGKAILPPALFPLPAPESTGFYGPPRTPLQPLGPRSIGTAEAEERDRIAQGIGGELGRRPLCVQATVATNR